MWTKSWNADVYQVGSFTISSRECFLLVPAGGGGRAWQPVLSRGRVHYVLPFHTGAEVGAYGNTSILSDDIEQRVVASPCPWRRTWSLHSGVTRMRVLERGSQLDEVRPPVPLPHIRSQLPPTLLQGLFLSLTQALRAGS